MYAETVGEEKTSCRIPESPFFLVSIQVLKSTRRPRAKVKDYLHLVYSMTVQAIVALSALNITKVYGAPQLGRTRTCICFIIPCLAGDERSPVERKLYHYRPCNTPRRPEPAYV